MTTETSVKLKMFLSPIQHEIRISKSIIRIGVYKNDIFIISKDYAL